MDNNKNIQEIINSRNEMIEKQKELCLISIERINTGIKELLKNDFGTMLVKNTAKDLSGELVRRFFNTADYYITADQLYDRLVNFSYDNEIDLLGSNDAIRKNLYNLNDTGYMESMQTITAKCETAQKQLFNENRKQDRLDHKGKDNYRKMRTRDDGTIIDEITHKEGTETYYERDGRKITRSELQADHIQAREAIKYNERYIREDKIEALKMFYNSPDNMQMIYAAANSSKKDIRVCEVNGVIEYLQGNELKSRQNKGEIIRDITYKASPRQLADAVIFAWEKDAKNGNKIQNLKDKGYLDEYGHVKPEVKKELLNNIKHSQNKESIEILKSTNYKAVSGDTLAITKKSLRKIIQGQILYYVMPPVIYETRMIVKKDNMDLDKFFKEIKKAEKRVMAYVCDKLGNIFSNIAGNAFNKFIKTFFDIIIETVKATVKRLLKVVKDLVLSLVNCCKILIRKDYSSAQKADAITKILSVTITSIVMEVMFEYLETHLGLPDILMEPLQIITTIFVTNIIMLILQKADLYNINYGLLVANIEKLFDEENKKFLMESTELYVSGTTYQNVQMEGIKYQINELEKSLKELNPYQGDAASYLNQISVVFNMDIDFDKEWDDFLLME